MSARRWRDAARALLRLDLELEAQEGERYISFEWPPGRRLRALLEHTAASVALALSDAHAAGIGDRDEIADALELAKLERDEARDELAEAVARMATLYCSVECAERNGCGADCQAVWGVPL